MPRKRPIMTSDHADKMEITVVFQCPPKGKEFYPNAFARGGLVNCPFVKE